MKSRSVASGIQDGRTGPARLGPRAGQRSAPELRQRFEKAFAGAAIGMALVDLDGCWLEVNDAVCRITGLARDEFKATTLQAITHPADAERDADSMQQLLDGRIASFEIEKRCRHAGGHYVWVLLTGSLVRDDRGRPRHVIFQLQDISGRRQRVERLEHLVDHDSLTGLHNRRLFERELGREVERVARYGGKGAVLMIDLDNFKSVNDVLGHRAGDDLLKRVAGVLAARVRQTDVLARVGGDEFAVVLPEADTDQARSVADGIVKALSVQVATLGRLSIRTTASIGVAAFEDRSALQLLECADVAMYEAKQAGRNRVAVYTANGNHGERSARLSEAELIRRILGDERSRGTLHAPRATGLRSRIRRARPARPGAPVER